ncbi:MAG: integrase core domain-containing protein [Micromonosporaceae bacterium]
MAVAPTPTRSGGGTVRRECLDRILVFGERHLRNVLASYVRHYDLHRPRRALQQRPPEPPAVAVHTESARIVGNPILGGLINEYSQAA